jgi:hypothetical protein
MSAPRGTLCFTCGLAVGAPPRLNRQEDGKVCPSCMERVLNSLPAALPGAASALEVPSSRSPAESAGPLAGEPAPGPRA